MSVAIATMGKFIPAVGSIVKEVEVEGAGGGGSSYGWERKKPQIIVDNVFDSEDTLRISVVKVKEWS
jgi:hypothetical protein